MDRWGLGGRFGHHHWGGGDVFSRPPGFHIGSCGGGISIPIIDVRMADPARPGLSCCDCTAVRIAESAGWARKGKLRPGYFPFAGNVTGIPILDEGLRYTLECIYRTGDTPIRTLINKTRRPVKIPLPGGKTLFLGPSRRGQVQDDTLERPAVKKLIEAGEIEVLDEKHHLVVEDRMSTQTHRTSRGHQGLKNQPRKGDR